MPNLVNAVATQIDEDDQRRRDVSSNRLLAQLNGLPSTLCTLEITGSTTSTEATTLRRSSRLRKSVCAFKTKPSKVAPTVRTGFNLGHTRKGASEVRFSSHVTKVWSPDGPIDKSPSRIR